MDGPPGLDGGEGIHNAVQMVRDGWATWLDGGGGHPQCSAGCPAVRF